MRNEILAAAKEAGFELQLFNSIDGDEVVSPTYGRIITDQLDRFSTLIANATLEKAAVKCDEYDNETHANYADMCAIAIRSMKT